MRNNGGTQTDMVLKNELTVLPPDPQEAEGELSSILGVD